MIIFFLSSFDFVFWNVCVQLNCIHTYIYAQSLIRRFSNIFSTFFIFFLNFQRDLTYHTLKVAWSWTVTALISTIKFRFECLKSRDKHLKLSCRPRHLAVTAKSPFDNCIFSTIRLRRLAIFIFHTVPFFVFHSFFFLKSLFHHIISNFQYKTKQNITSNWSIYFHSFFSSWMLLFWL